MRSGARILYLLRPDESGPPESLLRAAGGVQMLRAGSEPDRPSQDYGAHVICFHSPYDREMRVALEKVAALELPVLCLGDPETECVHPHASEQITVEDLSTMVGLLMRLANLHQLAATECRAEDAGECRGRVVEQMIALLEHLLTLRIPDYADRAGRVLEASLWIGSHLCLPPYELKDLSRAARLREIGKLGLPDRLLFARRTERTPVEQQAYDHYPVMGARVLREVPALRAAATIVEHQLENFDGTGPAGLMAHQIPLGSRVLRVAGAFTRMLHADDGARNARDVIAELDAGRGSLYDPLLVKLVENYLHLYHREVSKKTTRRVRVSDLQEGMLLAEDIWSRNGMKIIPAGTRVTYHLLRLLSQYPLDPTLEAVQILV